MSSKHTKQTVRFDFPEFERKIRTLHELFTQFHIPIVCSNYGGFTDLFDTNTVHRNKSDIDEE